MARRWVLFGLVAILLLTGAGGCWQECTGPQILIVVITLPADGSSFNEGDTVTFKATARTQQGEVPQGVSFAWVSDLDGTLGTGSTLNKNDLSAGTHEVTVTATSASSSTGAASITVTVTEVAAAGTLIVFIGSPTDGSSFPAGESIAFRAEARTPEGATSPGATFTWSSSRDGQIGTGPSFNRGDLSEGTHTITVTVSDSQGRGGNARVMISIGSASSESDATQYTLAPGKAPEDIVGMGFNSDGSVCTWYDDFRWSIGTPVDLDSVGSQFTYSRPKRRIVGISVGPDQYTYAWYDDGSYSRGGIADLDMSAGCSPYAVSSGRKPSDIVDVVFLADWGLLAFYGDGTYCAGPSPAQLDGPVSEYTHLLFRGISGMLPAKTPLDVVGIAGKLGIVDTTFWYLDGSYSTEIHPDSYAVYTPAPGRDPSSIVGIGSDTNGWIWTWYSDGTVSAGHKEDLASYRDPMAYTFPEDVPGEIIGMGISGSGTAYTWFSNGIVYAGDGSTPSGLWTVFAPSPYTLPPGKTLSDIVGMGIASDGSSDAVFVWYDDGTVTAGTMTDLDAYRAPYAYTLPAGKTPADIVGMAIAPNDHCYAWYDDGAVSAGTSSDLDAYTVAAP